MSASPPSPPRYDHVPRRISVELTNLCNLHCSYCVRDEDQLYHSPASFFPSALLRKVIKGSRSAYGNENVAFTGGEVTLHPRFEEIVETVAEENVKFSFVTNGWHFERVYPTLLKHRAALRIVGFSLDGATREAHDRWRGDGSFERVIRAVTRCYVRRIPFIFKVTIRRDTVPQLEQMSILAARMGAVGIDFSHLLPTSAEAESELALSLGERAHAEQEIGVIGNILKLRVAIAAGYYNLDPEAPCASLKGLTCNVDYRGRLTLCCNLAGYRGAGAEAEVVADLNQEEFAPAYQRLRRIADEQVERRRQALAAHSQAGTTPDLYTGSPCLYCLQSYHKIPWRRPTTGDGSRSLPVLTSATAGKGSTFN